MNTKIEYFIITKKIDTAFLHNSGNIIGSTEAQFL